MNQPIPTITDNLKAIIETQEKTIKIMEENEGMLKRELATLKSIKPKEKKKRTPKRNKGACKLIHLDQVRRMKTARTT